MRGRRFRQVIQSAFRKDDLVNLLRFQPPVGTGVLEHLGYPGADGVLGNRFDEKCIHVQRQGHIDQMPVGMPCDHNKRQCAVYMMFSKSDGAQELQPVHDRHVDVTNDEIDVRSIALKEIKCLLAVLGLINGG